MNLMVKQSPDLAKSCADHDIHSFSTASKGEGGAKAVALLSI
jgi:hypothetical protein